MNRPELRAWMKAIDGIQKQQTTASIDFYEKIRQGTSAEDIDRLRDIVDSARDETAVIVPNNIDQALRAFEEV